MATTNIKPLHTGKGRTTGKAISDIIDYAANPEKTENGKWISSYQCDSRIADAEFAFSKQRYFQKTGRKRGRDDVIAYHLRQSFVPGEITPDEANRLGRELAVRFTKGRYAFIVCTHVDKKHIHNHILLNSTSLDCTKKFRNFWGSSHAIQKLSDSICIENGYSIVEHPQDCGKRYDQWLGDNRPLTHREQLRAAIDTALAKKPDGLEALINLLKAEGVSVSWRGKSLRLKTSEHKRFVRMDAHSLGEDYALSVILEVLSGKREHRPQAEGKQADSDKINLLVDIQSRLQEGKGAGYAQWASLFNMKQIARTMSYLSEHDLLDYNRLKTKTAEVTAKYNQLSESIKAAEKRMAETAVLKTHIINYSKTRETYVAYRKSGYAKKFREEHESEILLHQAAKKAFDELGVTKLPTVKSLQTEYSALLTEKKTAYADYRKVREEMKELLVIQANVDQILGHRTSGREHCSVQKDRE